MAIRILGIPVTIISLGLSKIFMQRANDFYIRTGSFRNLLIKFTGALIALSIVLYVPFYFLVEFCKSNFRNSMDRYHKNNADYYSIICH